MVHNPHVKRPTGRLLYVLERW